MIRQLRSLAEILFAITINVKPCITQGLKLLHIFRIVSCSENLKERDCLLDVRADGRTILNGSYRNSVGHYGLDSCSSG